jgi:lipopolysaccharide export system permease protein
VPSGTPQAADQASQYLAELHSRIAAPFYPLAFLVLTYAYLGAPRTTRQSRAMSLVTAVALASALRGIGFVGVIAGGRTPAAVALPYLSLLAAFALGIWGISRGIIIEPPAFISDLVTAITERIARQRSAATGQTP